MFLEIVFKNEKKIKLKEVSLVEHLMNSEQKCTKKSQNNLRFYKLSNTQPKTKQILT